MVVRFKFDSNWGKREVDLITKEKSLTELLANPNKIKWLLDEFMRKSEYLISIEELK